MIHSEVLTHKMASKNAASSRARPIKGMIEDVRNNPARFEFWGQNESGMQANGRLAPLAEEKCQDIWEKMTEISALAAEEMGKAGAHKQHANRMIEPYGHITTLMTTSVFCLENYFSLRAEGAAEPTLQVLSYRMLDQYLKSTPKLLLPGEWHMPFADKMPEGASIADQLKVATARACWVSYNKHGKDEFELADAIERHDSSAELAHWSPFEHSAQALDHTVEVDGYDYKWSNFDYPSAGRDGRSWWLQYRKTFPNECRRMTREQLLERNANRPEWITV